VLFLGQDLRVGHQFFKKNPLALFGGERQPANPPDYKTFYGYVVLRPFRAGGLANAMPEAHAKGSQQPSRFYVDIRVDMSLVARIG